MTLSHSKFFSQTTQSEIYRLSAIPDQSVGAQKGTILAVHGLGDHIHCHLKAFELLCGMGYRVEGLDWPGNGKSAGRRGDIPSVKLAIKLMWEMVGRLDESPVGIYAHSTGGFVSLPFLERYGERLGLDFLWLSSPLLRPTHKQSRLKIAASEFLGDFFPELTVGTGIRPSRCFHINNFDAPKIAEEFKECHSRISVRFGRDLILWEEQVAEAARNLKDPLRVLFTQGTDDTICPARYAEKLFPTISVKDKTFLLVEGVRHEPLREPNNEAFLEDVRSWLESKTPPYETTKLTTVGKKD